MIINILGFAAARNIRADKALDVPGLAGNAV